MKFGIQNSSWLHSADPAEAFEAVKAKAQWAEDHSFVSFSALDHLIQIPRVGAPDEPFLEGWTVLAALVAVTSRIGLATLCTAAGYRNPAHPAKIAASVDLIGRGRLRLGIGDRLATSRELSPGFVGTVSEAVALVGQYQDAGIDPLINGDRNDEESRELFASDVMPHFA